MVSVLSHLVLPPYDFFYSWTACIIERDSHTYQQILSCGPRGWTRNSALLCSLLLDGDSECQDRLWNKTFYWGTSTNKYLPSYSIWVYHIPNLPTVSAIGDESWVVVAECRISLNDPSYNQPHHGRSRRYMSNDVSDFCIWFSHIILGLVRHQCQGLFEYVHINNARWVCVSLDMYLMHVMSSGSRYEYWTLAIHTCREVSTILSNTAFHHGISLDKSAIHHGWHGALAKIFSEIWWKLLVMRFWCASDYLLRSLPSLIYIVISLCRRPTS